MHDFRVANGATEILLIRHADAQHPTTTAGVDIKEIDLPLSARGREQAQRLAERLSTRTIGAIYASPLKRAMETAAPLAEALGIGVLADERLREIEIAHVGPVSLNDLAEIAILHGGWSHLPGTESSAAIRERMQHAVDAIVQRHPGQRIAVVSHAGAINAYFAQLLALPKDFFFPAGNTSINTLRARNERRLVVTLNDTAHLEHAT